MPKQFGPTTRIPLGTSSSSKAILVGFALLSSQFAKSGADYYHGRNVTLFVFSPRNCLSRFHTITGREDHHHNIDPALNLFQALVALKTKYGISSEIDRINIPDKARILCIFNNLVARLPFFRRGAHNRDAFTSKQTIQRLLRGCFQFSLLVSYEASSIWNLDVSEMFVFSTYEAEFPF